MREIADIVAQAFPGCPARVSGRLGGTTAAIEYRWTKVYACLPGLQMSAYGHEWS